MSGEIAPYETPAAIVLDPTGGRLVAWAHAAQAAQQLAVALSKTSFVPRDFQGQEHNATAAIMMGDELGLSPIAALRSIYVVHGSPALYARSMVALAQSHGHEVWTEKTSPTEVVVCGRRRGSEHVERSVWTIARATKARYTSNQKYASNPEEMLWSKAASEVARKIAADVLAGVPFSVEDLELEEPGPATTVSRSTPAPRSRVQRGKAPVPEEPSLEPELAEVSESGCDAGGISSPAPAAEVQPDGGGTADSPPSGAPHPQRVAIAARAAGLDDDGRHAVAWLASDGRVSSSVALSADEGNRALSICREIAQGQARLERNDAGDPVLISAQFGWEHHPADDPTTIEAQKASIRARLERCVEAGIPAKERWKASGLPVLSRLTAADLPAALALVQELDSQLPF